MQESRTINGYEKVLSGLLIPAGVGLIALALVAESLSPDSASGIGPNQLSLLLSGFIALATGTVLISSFGLRRIGEWLLLIAGVLAASFAADLVLIGGLPDFRAKHLVFASIFCCLLLLGAAPSAARRWISLAHWLDVLAKRREQIIKFGGIVVQLGLLALIIEQYQLENQAVYHNLMLLVFYGFLIHYLLPLRYRLPFFLLLSFAAIVGILGFVNSAWLILIGLGLIGIVHLPISFPVRILLVLLAGLVLALLRSTLFEGPLPVAVWPILGSMFMFRLIIYVYDLAHDKEPANFWRTLSYFFMLPNVVFAFFPVVDYATFRRTYYNEERHKIYQTGVEWILRGVSQLILYRFINYYVAIGPENVLDAGDLALYIISTYLLYLRVTGQFHLIIGILHLFGFNLPEANFRNFLASSFTDLWRRANIYWKDFMQKVFFYPTYYRLRKRGTLFGLLASTVIVIFVTWFLHAYQWFWLRGSIFFVTQDILFWTFLGIVLLANIYYENKRGRKRSLSKSSQTWKEIASRAVRVAGVFTTIAVLWSLWTSNSVTDWLSIWSVGLGSLQGIATLILAFVGLVIFFGLAIWLVDLPKKLLEFQQGRLGAAGPVLLNSGLILLLYLAGSPSVYGRLGSGVETIMADMTVSRLSDRDAALLQRGYYENLIGVNTFNTELWEIYSKRPSDWPLLHETEAARLTGEFPGIELASSTRIMFHGSVFSTNSWAMRDREYTLAPPPKTHRIALLGPSYVMGSGVADDETFEWLVEERWNEELADERGYRVEILNFGVASYSAMEELASLESKALSFEPDAIFLVAYHLEEEIVIRNLASRLRTGADIPFDYLVDVGHEAGIETSMPQTEAERRLKPYGPEILSWIYERIIEVARREEITPFWIYMPIPEIANEEGEPERLVKLAREVGFTVIDLSDAYEGYDLDSLAVAEWDRHPNAVGHRLLADAFYEALVEREIVPATLP